MIKRILVGLGGTDYTASAIHQGVALAKVHDAELTGVSIVDKKRLSYVAPVPIEGGLSPSELVESRLATARDRGEMAVKQFTDSCSAAGVRHDVLREMGEPFSLMIDKARYHDLMVFGLKSLFEFDTVEDPHDVLVRLVQSGVRPLIAVSRESCEVKKVLIAYSGSMESAKAMKRFVQMRLWPDLDVRIISFDDGGHNARQLLSDAATYCRVHGFRVETDCLSGSPKSQLLPYAESWGADMTVVGNSARHLLLRRIFGETALHVIKNAERPLFLAQ